MLATELRRLLRRSVKEGSCLDAQDIARYTSTLLVLHEAVRSSYDFLHLLKMLTFFQTKQGERLMTKLVLTPADTFFFKNHHATQAGETTVMESMFPPRPNTIYGALRAAYIYAYSSFDEFARGADERVKRWMGTPNERGAFRLHYCALADGDSLFLPLPLDYQVVEEGDSLKAYPLQLAKDRKPSSASTMWRLASSRREKTKSSQHRYVSLSEWKNGALTQSADRIASDVVLFYCPRGESRHSVGCVSPNGAGGVFISSRETPFFRGCLPCRIYRRRS